MSGKILIAVIAFLAGAAAVYGYQQVSANLKPLAHTEDEIRMAEIERQLAVALKKIEDLSVTQQNIDSDANALSSRISVLDGLFLRLEDKQAKSGLLVPRADDAQPPGLQEAPPSRSNAPANRRITGDELAQALREMPEDGRKILRRAIHEELRQIRDEGTYKMETNQELEKKAQASIKSLTAALSLTPVQVDQLTDIVGRQVDKILEIHRIVKENGDLNYARQERERTRTEAERELVDMLTPEQMDKLRELDPDGFGKRYPRGF